ncbi:acyl-CoA desaturase [Vibrio sp. 10N.286.49.C2]|uniref:fatty acid desaturase n=1 Tax=unclassified Vibrio TaxID=2614977 RepID=UPI000C8671FB|nr:MULTISPECIES: fatty acid desaturase [unclassified Vibrio]PMH31486.1 acyl-CoA desaturase [Vibrio sp. 10N.286.49.C2]PMH50507.1 acyl-CoA desaturase [Vibrio sp. 10N.286.49.B1]PMH78011.1 acyl-CoA desaturase [Vibrio sp. 10N.286.48.B7]
MSTTKKPPIIWLNVSIFLGTFLMATLGVTWYGFSVGYTMHHWIWLALSFVFCGMSITAGYHRLWSHKTYDAHPVMRYIFAIGGAFALQNSILHWSSDHRVHHKHVDNNDKDPYSAKRGFWYSHIGWMLREYQASRYTDYKNCRDLQRDPVVMWQHKHYVVLALIMNIAFPIGLGLLYGDVIGFALVVGALRLVLSHHTTFFINSLAHVWGSQPYTDKNTARDNGILAFLTFGEGYHNFHHIFEHDYRNGIRWWQFDPTKWLIKSCSWLGLTSNLKRVSAFKIEKARLSRTLQLTKYKVTALPDSERLLELIEHEFQQLVSKLKEYDELKKQCIKDAKLNVKEKYEQALLTIQLEQLEDHLRLKKQQWFMLINNPQQALS